MGELWGWGQTHMHAHRQTHRHINTMTRPGLGAGPSENLGMIGSQFSTNHLVCYFSLTRPSGPGQSKSRDVHLCIYIRIYMSPPDVI